MGAEYSRAPDGDKEISGTIPPPGELPPSGESGTFVGSALQRPFEAQESVPAVMPGPFRPDKFKNVYIRG